MSQWICISHRLSATSGMLVNTSMLVHILTLSGLSFFQLAHDSFLISITFFNDCINFSSQLQQLLFLNLFRNISINNQETDQCLLNRERSIAKFITCSKSHMVVGGGLFLNSVNDYAKPSCCAVTLTSMISQRWNGDHEYSRNKYHISLYECQNPEIKMFLQNGWPARQAR